MPAFVIFIKEQTIDQVELDLYSENVGVSFTGHNLRFLAAYGEHEVLEGPPMEGAVILEFDDMARARAWYRSPAYQAAANHRFKGASYRAFLVQGR